MKFNIYRQKGHKLFVSESKVGLPDILLRPMFDHKIDKDRPEVCAFWVARQDFVKHGATSLCITVPELHLSKLCDHIYT